MQSFQIKSNRAGHFIVLLLVLLLMFVAFWAFFIKEEPLELDATGVIILSIVAVIGGACIFFAVKMIIQKPAVITINENGFEYNPGGISSGFTPWSNVADIKPIQMRTIHGNLNGPVWEEALGIKLKDSSLYRKQFNPLLRSLMGFNKNMYDADIFFRLSSFGKQADEVCRLMLQTWQNRSQIGKDK